MADKVKYKTGLVRAPAPPKLELKSYLLPEALPPLPPVFGHQSIYAPRDWGMLNNNQIGDCTVAGAMHVVMLWRALAKKWVTFTPLDALEDYSAITGYTPYNPSTDTGADMVQVAKYWQSRGFRDSQANRHTILAYLHIDPANLEHIDTACYLFEAVGLGVSVGDEEEQAFVDSDPWGNPDSPVSGYHYVPMIGKNPQYRQVITWGGLQDITENWLKAKCTEVVAIISDENLINGKSAEGFDLDRLEHDLTELG